MREKDKKVTTYKKIFLEIAKHFEESWKIKNK